jgi:hypothetical protein
MLSFFIYLFIFFILMNCFFMFTAAAPQTNSLFGTTSQPSTFGTQPTGFAGFGTQNQV